MESQGKVSGLDVIDTGGQGVRCLAFVTQEPGGSEIQVVALEPRLQSALELACATDSAVEVTHDDTGGEKVLSRVRLLDR